MCDEFLHSGEQRIVLVVGRLLSLSCVSIAWNVSLCMLDISIVAFVTSFSFSLFLCYKSVARQYLLRSTAEPQLPLFTPSIDNL